MRESQTTRNPSCTLANLTVNDKGKADFLRTFLLKMSQNIPPEIQEIHKNIAQTLRFTVTQVALLDEHRRNQCNLEQKVRHGYLKQIRIFFVLVLVQTLLLIVSSGQLLYRVDYIEKLLRQELPEQPPVQQAQPETCTLCPEPLTITLPKWLPPSPNFT